MITNDGRAVIRQYFAGQTPQIAASMAFGVGDTAATVNDKVLRYEVIRKSVSSINADLANNRIVFKSSLIPGEISRVYEIGLFSEAVIPDSTRTFGNTSIGLWSGASMVATNARANPLTVKVDYVASGTTNAELTGFSEDLSRFTANSTVVVGFHATTNLSSVRVRLGTDAANYFEFVLTGPVLNSYNIYKVLRSTATVTGAPSWDNIVYMAVRPSGTAGGAGSIFFDGIRFEGGVADTSLLVARSVLTTPTSIDLNVTSDIEYSLEVNFT